MRLWVWRHFRIELPDDWEMLQFSRNIAEGRCAFADRHQFRLEMSWRVAERAPDLQRLMSDYLAKLRLEGALPDAALTPAPPLRERRGGWGERTAGPWRGIAGHQREVANSRFGRYFGAERCLIEIVFLWPASRDVELEAKILSSIAPEPERPDCLRRWKAFGMDLLAPSDLSLRDCTVEPANVRMTFADARGTRQETFQRLGMVPEWLKSTVRDWLTRQKPAKANVRSQASVSMDGHQVETLGATERAGVLRKEPQYEAAAWICPSDGRLYSVRSLAPGPDIRRRACIPARGSLAPGPEIPRAGMHALPGRRLSCCDGMRVERACLHAAGSPQDRTFSVQVCTPYNAQVSWRGMLEARPVRNAAVEVARGDGDELSVSVKTRRPRCLVPPISWIVPLKPYRTVKLDRIGARLWDLCDGDRTVEAIVDEFARAYTLSFHEARVAVTTYLSQLVQRGVLAVVMPDRPLRRNMRGAKLRLGTPY